MTSKNISEVLQSIVGLPLRRLGRAANMLWLGFGADREGVSPLGRVRLDSEWALHVQCVWRLCQSGRIVIGYRDFYYSINGDALDDWDSSGTNCFDVVTAKLRTEFEIDPPTVQRVESDDVGGFMMELERDYRLAVFPDGATENERWRLFQPGMHQPHIVV